MPHPRRPDGRRRPRIRVNIVYRSIQAAGGPSRLAALLGVSLQTLAYWRRTGVVPNARAVFEWIALIHEEPSAQLALGRALAGLRPPRRPRS
jgi:hypothetical protein